MTIYSSLICDFIRGRLEFDHVDFTSKVLPAVSKLRIFIVSARIDDPDVIKIEALNGAPGGLLDHADVDVSHAVGIVVGHKVNRDTLQQFRRRNSAIGAAAAV